ncbi:MAG: right-handed parallel beta-helix repeat-containing protein [Planctomycetota bacterium]|nr:right-handed parallel beta-helix repeat-containing protein [Planctomycetota bacterium]
MRNLAGLVILAMLACGSSPAAEYYVATDGNDEWSGKLAAPNADKTDGPFATLPRARDEVRKAKAAGQKEAVTVYVRGGIHPIPQTLKLGPEDAGTADAPVVYRAFEAEKPVLIGGRRITGFVPYKDKIAKADVGAQGFQGIYFRQLIMDGKRQHLARYPNYDPQNPYGGGWAYADGKPIPMYQDVPNETKRVLQYKAEDSRTWARPEEGEVFVFARYNWWNNICRIAKVERETRTVTLASDASYPIRPGDRYYVRNLLEELDSPGEWYLDRKDWTLYFWPPAALENAAVYAPTTRTILELGKGAAYIQIRGFTIECCEGTAIALKETSHCLIACNTIRNVGDYNGSGVSVDGGLQNGVVGNDIFEVGSHGVSLSGGDRKTLTPAGNYADNNYIHHFGVYYKQGCGISMNGVGNRASRNLMHDGPRMGIIFSGNNLVIEYNHIRHVNLETEDTGAVYTGGRDWISSRGTVVRYNYFHDILGYGKANGKWISPHFAWGVYLDDNTGGVDVIGNILVRCSRAGLHLHNGRDNWIENNILVDNGQQQVEYNGWTGTNRMWRDHFPTMVKGYEMVADQPAWKNMRNMDLHPSKAVLPDGKIMTGNRFLRNIVSYRDPSAKCFRFNNLPLDHYESDYNLVFHGDKPITTGFFKIGKETSENLLRNAGFEEGETGKLPKDWFWQEYPTGGKAAIVEEAGAAGKFCLRIDGATSKNAKGNTVYPIIVSADVPAKPGQAYRLTARLKADKAGSKALLMGQSYVANVYFWNRETTCMVGTEWKDYELLFKLPAPGEQGYNEKMKALKFRVDFREESGVLWVDEASLKEAEALDEWESWKTYGFDKHSLIADPLFVAPEKDDYRLKPDSPAFKLGFKAIDVDKIGPYQDPLRASWPIVEAEGVREHPLVNEKKP